MGILRRRRVRLVLGLCCLVPTVWAIAVAPAAHRAAAEAGDGAVPAPQPDPGRTVLNVKHPQFGAVGDGLTDDAPAINRALEAARKTTEYGQGSRARSFTSRPASTASTRRWT